MLFDKNYWTALCAAKKSISQTTVVLGLIRKESSRLLRRVESCQDCSPLVSNAAILGIAHCCTYICKHNAFINLLAPLSGPDFDHT